MKAYELAEKEIGTVEWQNGNNPTVRKILSRCVLQDSGCLLWQGNRNRPAGYGRLRLDGKMILAHRAIWSVINGDIPAGVEVCHKCDNPLCCNPEHLFLGTHTDNMRDMSAKGRTGTHFGIANVNAKLTPDSVRAIRKLSGTFSQRKIAEMHGVNQAAVWAILAGKTWSHVT